MRRLICAALIGALASLFNVANAEIVCVEEAGGVCLKFEKREPAPKPKAAPQASPAQRAESALGLSREKRRDVQRGLAAAGFYDGEIDGALGPMSRRAIRNWQSERGQSATGYLTRAQADALRSEFARLNWRAPSTEHPRPGAAYTERWNERLTITHGSDQDMEGAMTARLTRRSDDQADLIIEFDSATRPSASFDGACVVPLRSAASCRIRGPLNAAVTVTGSLPNLRIANKVVAFW